MAPAADEPSRCRRAATACSTPTRFSRLHRRVTPYRPTPHPPPPGSQLLEMSPLEAEGKQRLVFEAPSRGLIGFRAAFAAITRGTGVLHRAFARCANLFLETIETVCFGSAVPKDSRTKLLDVTAKAKAGHRVRSGRRHGPPRPASLIEEPPVAAVHTPLTPIAATANPPCHPSPPGPGLAWPAGTDPTRAAWTGCARGRSLRRQVSRGRRPAGPERLPCTPCLM